jgi:hypothetical protein
MLTYCRRFLFILLAFFCFPVIFAPTVVAGGSLLFQPTLINTTIGTDFNFSIFIDTAGAKLGGAGAKIKFDPDGIIITKITPGTLFPDYPSLQFDNQAGTITISGIVPSRDNLFNGQGLFASVTARVKNLTTSQLTFDFTPGSTSDSNLAITAPPWDVLDTVNILTVEASELLQPTPLPSTPVTQTSPNLYILLFAGILILAVILIRFFRKIRSAKV